MPDDQWIPADDDPRQGPGLLDGMLCNGVDSAAERRAHMRELTMARQAAERRHARPTSDLRLDRQAQALAARARDAELRAELARIDDAHRTWLRAQGEDVPELPARNRIVKETGGR